MSKDLYCSNKKEIKQKMTSDNDIEKYFKPSLIPPTIKSKCRI
jgi:hypothetical protein